MQISKNGLLSAISVLFIAISANAQVFEISAYGSSSALFGDFTQQDLNMNGAGYSSDGIGMGVEFKYYTKKNLGFGLRSSSVFYSMDREEYEDDLLAMLAVNNENYDFSEAYGYASFGSELGISYLFNFSDKFQLEPYFYLGAQGLATPRAIVVYEQNNLVYTYETKLSLFGGFSYAPGLRFKWNIQEHFGLSAYAEYQGKSFFEDEVTQIKKSYNSLEIKEVDKTYMINGVTVGFGLTFRFGKGLGN